MAKAPNYKPPGLKKPTPYSRKKEVESTKKRVIKNSHQTIPPNKLTPLKYVIGILAIPVGIGLGVAGLLLNHHWWEEVP